MLNKITLYLSSTLLLIAIILLSLNLFMSSSKYVYIDITEVFEEFELKKELSKEYEKMTFEKNEILNGLSMEIEKLRNKIKDEKDVVLIEEYKTKREFYLNKKEEFDGQNNLLLEKYDSQVFSQFNQYIKDYGKNNNYDLIFGANGQGSLMYGKDDLNITKDVIEYINNRYKGITNE
jgi:outer membrane protein